MHRLDVLFSPAETGSRELRGKTILVADVLRFSSTATLALAMGARAVYPFDNLSSLRSFAKARPGVAHLTLGEQSGVPVPGLDLDNSPSALTTELCSGKDVLALTTNGTRVLKSVENRGLVILLSFNNISACASFTAAVQGEGVVLCAGSSGRFSNEDALAAGAFVVEALRRNPDLELSDEAKAARDLFVKSEGKVAELVAQTGTARALASSGRQADVDLCSAVDSAPVVPVYRGSPARLTLVESPPVAFAAPGAGADPEEIGEGEGTAEGEAAPDHGAPENAPGPEGGDKAGSPGATGGGDRGNGGGDTAGASAGDGKGPGSGGAAKELLDDARKIIDEYRMPLGEHLTELRKRLIYSIAIALLAFVVIFSIGNPVIDVVLKPVQKAFDTIQKSDTVAAGAEKAESVKRPTLIAIKPYEVFMTQVKISFIIGLFLSSPFIFLQLWLFVSKGLYPWEKKWVFVFAPATYLSFVGGVVFLYFVVLPVGLQFLVGYGNHPDLMRTTGYEAYVTFFLTMALVMGLVFELPLIMVFLARLGLIRPKTFAAKRKHVVVGLFVLSALITPPDVITQLLVGLPLVILYEIGIILSRLTYKERSLRAS